MSGSIGREIRDAVNAAPNHSQVGAMGQAIIDRIVSDHVRELHALIRTLYLEDIRSPAQNELLASIVTTSDGPL